MLKLLIFILGVAKVLGLKCHDCDNFDTASCLEIETTNGKFLSECKKNETRCALMVAKNIDPQIIRKCVPSSWNCDIALFKCQTCTSNGCNIGIEIETEIQLPSADLIMANIYGLGIIVLLVAVVVIGCVVRHCTKSKDIVYEEEDECDEYYENETNIDLE